MKYISGNDLRKMFLDFFASKNHMVEEASGLVPKNDPSLLWINSGVSALKKYFDGSTVLSNPRITNSQRSLRTNDIENVGLTARHHTMFEMLGNFSIGDYFKKEAVEFAWEFLTSDQWIGLDKDKLYVTIYPSDTEAYDIWHNVIGLDDSRIFKLDGNFWEIGSGPCGPNSEIFYDRGLDYDPDNIGIDLLAKDMDNDRYIEVWNIVFSQYNAQENQSRDQYEELPQQNIDTGMGLERLASLVQEANTNFETDLFMPIIKECEKLSNTKYEDHLRAYRVIADHLRAITFALSDGAMFSNEGRGYVLKRLLRRASRFGRELNFNKPTLYLLVDVIVDNMKEAYPYLVDKKELVSKMVYLEEERFQKTLESGIQLLENIMANSNEKVISGEDAFKLYDTYGFPIEIVQEICLESNFSVDMNGFEIAMEKQKELARSHHQDSSNMAKQSADLLNFKQSFNFIGYDNLDCDAIVTGIFIDGVQSNELNNEGYVSFDQSVFYAESGGQVSDQGYMIINGIEYEVLKVMKAPNKQHLHLVNAPLKVGDKVSLKVNSLTRALVSRNHSATHLLHKALKDVVGSHVNQAGSYCSDEYLRFDFTHFEKISDEKLKRIERIVNEEIFNSHQTLIQNMSLEKAKQLKVTALFDEKYEDEVRVVAFGEYSTELCGGCHVTNTSEIGLFMIEKEDAVGSGIRRITAKTSKNAYQNLISIQNIALDTKNIIQAQTINDMVSKSEDLVNNNKSLNQQITELKKELLTYKSSNISDDMIKLNNDINLLVYVMEDNINDMKDFVQRFKNEHDKVIVIVKGDSTNNTYVTGVSNDLHDIITARDIANLINDKFEGKGGGKPDLAQGKTNHKIDDMIIELINNIL